MLTNIVLGRRTGHAPGTCSSCGAVAMISLTNSSGTRRSAPSVGWPKCRLTPRCEGRVIVDELDAEGVGRPRRPRKVKSLALALVLVLAPAWLDLPPEGIYAPATAATAAERLDPPPTTLPTPPTPTFTSASSSSTCTGALELLEAYSPGWDARRMARLAYRESRCQPAARNRSSSATGLLQILASHCAWLADELDTWCTRERLTDPTFNVRAAAALWREQGYGAWST